MIEKSRTGANNITLVEPASTGAANTVSGAESDHSDTSTGNGSPAVAFVAIPTQMSAKTMMSFSIRRRKKSLGAKLFSRFRRQSKRDFPLATAGSQVELAFVHIVQQLHESHSAHFSIPKPPITAEPVAAKPASLRHQSSGELSLSQILLEGRVATAAEGITKTPARPSGGRVRSLSVVMIHCQPFRWLLQRSSFGLMNDALSELMPVSLDAPLTAVHVEPAANTAHYIPPRFTSQGSEGRVHRKSSHDRILRRSSSGLKNIVEEPKADKKQDSVWFEYGAV